MTLEMTPLRAVSFDFSKGKQASRLSKFTRFNLY